MQTNKTSNSMPPVGTHGRCPKIEQTTPGLIRKNSSMIGYPEVGNGERRSRPRSRTELILAGKCGSHLYDQWSVDELLVLAREIARFRRRRRCAQRSPSFRQRQIVRSALSRRHVRLARDAASDGRR
jgi:hypothetical protein